MLMEEFITKISILKDALATTGDILKEAEVILIALGALDDEYEAFVTSITTRFDPTMTFATLCELLMDQEINPLSLAQSVNAVVKPESRPTQSVSPSPKSDLKYQICQRKVHSALNYYNKINLSHFPPTHNRELSPFNPNGNNRSSIWYLGATSHITSSSDNIQHPHPFSSNHCILTADESAGQGSGHS